MANINQTSSQFKLLSLKQLIELTGLSRSSIYNRISPKSRWHDPNFPKPVKLGDDQRASLRWLQSEVDNWIQLKLNARQNPSCTSNINDNLV